MIACEAIYKGVARERTKQKTQSMSLYEAACLFR